MYGTDQRIKGVTANQFLKFNVYFSSSAGDAMNTSSRMMSFGEVGKIHVSE